MNSCFLCLLFFSSYHCIINVSASHLFHFQLRCSSYHSHVRSTCHGGIHVTCRVGLSLWSSFLPSYNTRRISTAPLVPQDRFQHYRRQQQEVMRDWTSFNLSLHNPIHSQSLQQPPDLPLAETAVICDFSAQFSWSATEETLRVKVFDVQGNPKFQTNKEEVRSTIWEESTWIVRGNEISYDIYAKEGSPDSQNLEFFIASWKTEGMYWPSYGSFLPNAHHIYSPLIRRLHFMLGCYNEVQDDIPCPPPGGINVSCSIGPSIWSQEFSSLKTPAPSNEKRFQSYKSKQKKVMRNWMSFSLTESGETHSLKVKETNGLSPHKLAVECGFTAQFKQNGRKETLTIKVFDEEGNSRFARGKRKPKYAWEEYTWIIIGNEYAVEIKEGSPDSSKAPFYAANWEIEGMYWPNYESLIRENAQYHSYPPCKWKESIPNSIEDDYANDVPFKKRRVGKGA